MERKIYLDRIKFAFRVSPVVAILGPRQCGKTTLSQQYIALKGGISPENYFDLENDLDIARLGDPFLTLSGLSGLIVIDEIQKIPELFTCLRVLVDNPKLDQKYLILGSASRQLLRQSSETLAGRISYLELTPFSIVEAKELDILWLRGGYPRSFLADDESVSVAWRKGFIKTYLEQDIPNLGIDIAPENLRRFWMLLAHTHGGILNASELGRTLGFSYKTMQNYLDVLSGTFMVRQLRPWFANIAKRQVKSPKVYMRDSGIYHALVGVNSVSQLQLFPKLGASWEGFALEEVIRYLNADQEECYFWATHQQAELDLLIVKDGKKLGFEFKYASAPKLTKSMQIAQENLKLDALTVIYPGSVNYLLKENIEVIGLKNYFL